VEQKVAVQSNGNARKQKSPDHSEVLKAQNNAKTKRLK